MKRDSLTSYWDSYYRMVLVAGLPPSRGRLGSEKQNREGEDMSDMDYKCPVCKWAYDPDEWGGRLQVPAHNFPKCSGTGLHPMTPGAVLSPAAGGEKDNICNCGHEDVDHVRLIGECDASGCGCVAFDDAAKPAPAPAGKESYTTCDQCQRPMRCLCGKCGKHADVEVGGETYTYRLSSLTPAPDGGKEVRHEV